MVDDGSGGAAGVGGAMHRRTDDIIATASSSLEEFIELQEDDVVNVLVENDADSTGRTEPSLVKK